MRQRDQMQALQDDPALIPSAVEELMRYDNPVQIVWRYAAEDLEVGGKEIHQGQFINLIVGAANRDAEQFRDPDRLDVTRQDVKHLGFGLGIHFCVGAALARLESVTAFRQVLQRMENLTLESGTLEWETSPTFRGVKSLPVRF